MEYKEMIISSNIMGPIYLSIQKDILKQIANFVDINHY